MVLKIKKVWARTIRSARKWHPDVRRPLHAAVIGALLGGVMAPMANWVVTNGRYQLGASALAVIEHPQAQYTDKLSDDHETRATVFNKDGLEAVKDAMTDKLQTSVGRGTKDAQLYSATLPQAAGQAIAVHDNVNDVSVGFVPQLALLEGRRQDGHVIYPIKGQPGAMVFTPKAGGLKEDIVLEKAPAADRVQFDYSLNLPEGVEVRLDQDGSVGFYSATPELYGDISYGSGNDFEMVRKARVAAPKTYLMFRIPAPTIRQTGRPGAVKARFALEHHQLSVIVNGLKAGGYPLSIDPTFLITSTSDFVLGSIDDNIDLSVADQVGRQALVGGSTPGWNPNDAPNLSYAQFASSLVAYNGYLYLIGGGSGPGASGTTTADVRYISLDPTSGALGTTTPTVWTQTAQLQTARQGLVSFGFNGYLYAVGGQNNSGVPVPTTQSVEYAKINSDGSVGTWNYSSNLNTARNYPAGAVYQGVLYVMGGTNGTNNATPLSSMEWARINGDGSVGSWTQSSSSATGNLTSARSKARGYAYNGYVYLTGGQTATSPNSAVLNTVEYAAIKSDGSLGAWTSTTSFPTPRRDHGMVINNGYLYVFGGCSGATQACTGFIGDTQYASINADGSVGQWQSTVPYNTGGFNSRMPGGFAVYSNHLYFVGGCSTETATNNCSTQLVGTFITNIDTVGRFDRGISTNGSSPYTGTSTVARMGARAVALNGYLYLVGGCSTSGCSDYSDVVEYAPLNADGTLGTFATTTTLPAGSGNNAGRLGHTLVAYRDKLHVIGGVERQPASSGFPTVSSVTTSNYTTNVTTHNVSMPGTVAAGDLLICLFTNDGSATVTTPAGWSSISSTNNGTNVRASVLAKVATGSEGGTTVNFQTSATEQANAHVYRIPAANWYGDLNGVEATGVSAGTTTAPNPPSLSPSWGSDNTLWLAYAGGSSYDGVNSYPSGYTNGFHTQSNTGTAGASTASARLTSAVATNNPGSFSMASSESGVAVTVAIRPVPPTTPVYVSTVLTAGQNSDGTLGSWSEQGTLGGNNLPAARSFHTSSIWHDKVYVLGGRDDTSVYGTIYYATIAADGTIGSWNTASTSIQARWGASGGIWGKWLYVAGGQSNTSGTYIGTSAGSNAVQRLTIDTASGDVTAASGFAADASRRFATAVVMRGFLYIMGGNTSGSTAADDGIAWAALDPVTGNPGTFATTNIGNRGDQTAGIATARSLAAGVVTGGYLYVLGGCTSAIGHTSYDGCGSFVPTNETAEQYLPNNGGTGQTSDFAATTSLPAGVADHAAVAYNNVLYVIGGCTAYTTGACSNATTSVRSATINPDGTLGATWNTETSLPTARSELQAVAYAGYMYVVGGKSNSQNATRTVWYAPIASTGTLGSWVDTSSNYLPVGADRVGFGLVVSNGYLYTAGGDNGSGTKKNDVYYAQLNTGDGSLSGGWTATTAFNTARSAFGMVAYNGRIYVAGGTDGSTSRRGTQFASQNSDGTLGAWQYTTDISRGSVYRQMVAANGFMYYIGNELDEQQVKYTSINADGTLGRIQTSVPKLLTPRAHGSATFFGGSFYTTGGCTLTGGVCTTGGIKTAVSVAGQQAISRTGHYSKLFDTQVNTSPTQLVMNGSINGPGAAVELRFQTASTSDPVLGVPQLIRPVIFGNYYNVQALNSSGQNVGVAKLYLYLLTLDDSRSGTFPDVPNTGSGFGQTASTDITLYYHANPGRRLRHGASFTDTDCNPNPAQGCILDTAP
jgi:hypothetical protein